MKMQFFLVLLRISMGFIFLWAFVDKLFGFGFATVGEKSWLEGNSPTSGFLTFGTDGPFKPLFASLAGSQVIDVLFMAGLLGVGLALMLGIAKKLSTLAGSLMLLLMWLATFPPENNPLIDDHIIYLLVLQLLLQLRADEVFGLGTWWNNTPLVKRFRILR